jgi:hypothetical protein
MHVTMIDARTYESQSHVDSESARSKAKLHLTPGLQRQTRGVVDGHCGGMALCDVVVVRIGVVFGRADRDVVVAA